MNSGVVKVIITILLLSFSVIIFISMRGFGSLQSPDISIQNIAEICNIEESRIDMIKENDLLEFKYESPSIEGTFQSIKIGVGPTSKEHLNQIRKAQFENDLKEYPNIGDGAFIYTFHLPPWPRTLWLSSEDTTYRIQSIVSGCNDDTKLLKIGEKILANI